TSPAKANDTSNAVDGSGMLVTSPESVTVPVAARAWEEALPLQLSVSVPVSDPVCPRTPFAPTFSVKVEFWLNADCPAKKKPLRFCGCRRLPVKTLPAPVLLPDGTVNGNERLFRLAIGDEKPAQPAPEQDGAEVRKVPPVSRPLVVTPRSKVPPDKLSII